MNDILDAPGTRIPGSPASDNRRRAIAVARLLLRSSNRDSDTALLAREFLRAIGVPE